MFHFGTSSKGRKKKKERATKEPTCAKIAQVRQEVSFDSITSQILSSINDVQSLLQATESLALKVEDMAFGFNFLASYLFYSCQLCFEFASEGLIAILNGNGIIAFWIFRDVDVEAHDAACIDGFLIDDFA